MIIMAAILVMGIALLIGFFVNQGHRFNRDFAAIKANIEGKVRAIVDKDDDLRKHLIASLVGTDLSTRESITRWQRDRSSLMPGTGAIWTSEDLKKRRNQEFVEQIKAIKQQALRRVGIGAVTIVSVMLMLLLGAYAHYSGQTSRPTIDSTQQQPPDIDSTLDEFLGPHGSNTSQRPNS